MGEAKRYLRVSKRALVQRLNRKLRRQDEALRSKRGPNTGEYYLVDIGRNVLLKEEVDLEKLGRELGALAPYERLADDQK
jgi:hypothetical protein